MSRRFPVVALVLVSLLVPSGPVFAEAGGVAPGLETLVAVPTGPPLPAPALDQPPLLGRPPPGLGGMDPWVDAGGDAMFGALDMDTYPVVFAGGMLWSDEPGVLKFGGKGACLAGAGLQGCGTVTRVEAGAGLAGGPITDEGKFSIAPGGVTSAMVADGAIQLQDLAFDPLTEAELDAHKASGDHDARYAARDELSQPGALNDAANPVHWTKLQGVPAGFADGQDADTTYSAGAGLSLSGTTFRVDIASVQARVAGACAEGWAVRSVAQDGSVVCEPDDDTLYSAGSGLALSGTTFRVDTGAIQSRVTGTCAEGNSIRVVNMDGTVACEADTVGWGFGGNTGTMPGRDFLGTTDDTPLELRVNGARALRLEPSAESPSVVAGHGANRVAAGVAGASVAGGGGAGAPNAVTDSYGAVAGGANNQAGDGNAATNDAPYATVAGGSGNKAAGIASNVGGGEANQAAGGYASLGGGRSNEASGNHATLGGGRDNVASGLDSVLGGGQANTASGNLSTIAGGRENTANGTLVSIGGGILNVASGLESVVGGGMGNVASGDFATIAGGRFNEASATASFVAGSEHNIARGPFSFAAGFFAEALHQGSFVWADSIEVPLQSKADNEVTMRATGGVRFVSGVDPQGQPKFGVVLKPGASSWSTLSDRDSKDHVVRVDGRSVAERLASIPIGTWNWKSQDEDVRHMGPMAQDFHAAFGLGEDEARISSVDADGVALAAIQGLYFMVQEQQQAMARQEQRLAQLEERLARLEALAERALHTGPAGDGSPPAQGAPAAGGLPARSPGAPDRVQDAVQGPACDPPAGPSLQLVGSAASPGGPLGGFVSPALSLPPGPAAAPGGLVCAAPGAPGGGTGLLPGAARQGPTLSGVAGP